MMSKKKIRVLHILNSGSYSGAEKVAILIMKALDEYCESFYLSPDGCINHILKEEELLHYSVKKVTPVSVRRAVKELDPDIIHAHDFKNSIASALSGTKIPIFCHLHNNPPWLKKVNAKSFAFFLCRKKFAKILTVSDAVINEYVFGKQLKKQTFVVGNPVDIHAIVERSEDYPFDEAMDLVLIGRLVPQKNPLRFVRIAEHLREYFPTIRCGIIGDGELRDDLNAEITKKKLGENVKLFGYVDNPFPILAKSRILCITSDWEGFGLVAVEALALGVPVVCTSVGGLPGIVNEVCGAICDSETEMINAIEKLLANEERYRFASEEARKRAEELDNYTSYMEEMKRIYLRSLG